jgi:type VI secretion system secreted protein VgrG
MPEYTQEGRPLRIYTPLGDDALLLERVQGQEFISQPFQFEVDLLSTSDSVSADDLIRQAVHIEIDRLEGPPRIIHARVCRFVQRGRRHVLTLYSATLRPWFWFLSLRQDCKIFQNMTVPDIIEKIFSDNGFTDYNLKLYKSYSPREYCVQYRESSMDFVSRLMEDEGIFYYFEHTEDKHTLVLVDAVATTEPCPGQDTASMMPVSSVVLSEDVIVRADAVVQARTGIITLNDYNFETPANSLLSTSSGDPPEEVYDYPGKYADRSGGDRYADLRLQEQETPVKILQAEGTCRGFTAGYTFTLQNHYRRDFNESYLLTSLKLFMETSAYTTDAREVTDDYRNQFEAVPSSVAYRPPRVTPRPSIAGVQTALVVGRSGEEIYSDNYGRVKVQFYWDRLGKKDENSSCWVRVSQEWAGKNWGSIHIPRIGQEVIVDFLEGDPDRPIVTGRVYNADQMPPYGLPDNQTQSGIKTRSSKGGGADNFNEIRFEDKKGSEMLTVHAEKDMETEVENDETRTVKHDRITTITNDETKTVEQGNETITLKMGNQSITLKMGNQKTEVSLGKIETEAMQSIELKVGQSSVKLDQMGVTIKGMQIQIEGQIMVDVKGVMVQVSADAMLILKGGITMIN